MTKATDSEASTDKLKVHDTVRHDFSGGRGKLLEIRESRDIYTHFVMWDDGLGEWYKPDVLVKVTEDGSSMDSQANNRSSSELAPPTPVEVGDKTVHIPPPNVNETTETVHLGDNLDTLLEPFTVYLRNHEVGMDKAILKQALTSLINQTVEDARGCIDCKTLRCENCERLWQT